MSDASRAKDDKERPRAVAPEHLRAVRLGHGANCSSIGSVIDTLFAGALAAGAIFAAVAAAMAREPVTVVGEARKERPRDAENDEKGAS